MPTPLRRPALAWRALCLPGLVLAAGAACTADAGEPAGTPAEPRTTTIVRALPRTKLDLLFVIDNSSSMREEQANTAAQFAAILAALERLPAGLPDLHVAVVSSDVGVGAGGPTPRCTPAGDAGRFRLGLDDACPGVDGRYLTDAPLGGGRQGNYAGSLVDAFGCIAQLGDQGCGFEQPLEAMRLALANPAHAGFVRDDAMLWVILIGDEDDCSTHVPERLFDASQDSLDAELGRLSSYRCFEQGVVCAPDAPRDAPADGSPAQLHGCRPREGSLVAPLAGYTAALRAIKPERADLAVTVVNGDPDAVAIRRTRAAPGDGLELVPSWEYPGGGASYPAVRLAAFVGEFGDHGSLHVEETRSASHDEPDLAMATNALDVIQMMDSSCLAGPLVDRDAPAGSRPACEVDAVVGLGSASERRRRLERCGAGPTPCWDVVEDPGFCDPAVHPEHLSRLRLVVRGDQPAPGQAYVATCARAR